MQKDNKFEYVFINDDQSIKLKNKSKSSWLRLNAILKFEEMTGLHCDILIGDSNAKTNYASKFAK